MGMYDRIRKDRRGFTGIEAAIVLIAFVVVAAVFSFVALNMGMLATEKSKDSISVSLATATSSLARVGLAYGLDVGSDATTADTEIEAIQFFFKLTQRSSIQLARGDFKMIYTEIGAAPLNLVADATATQDIVVTFTSAGITASTTASAAVDFAISNVASPTDTTVDYGELWTIILVETPDNNDIVTIELVPPSGTILSFTLRIPSSTPGIDATPRVHTLDVITA